MKIIVCKNYQEMSERAAGIVAEQVKNKPESVLGLATGSTPEGMYSELVKMYASKKISFAKVKTVNLDEYYPIAPENDQSYRYFMNYHLFSKVDINLENTNVPDGSAQDPDEEAVRYEELVESMNGIDVQILGIGRNAHIGFNEPDEELIPVTHVTKLTDSTIEANSKYFESAAKMPHRALTMGIGSIMKAKKIVIMASGAEKKFAVSKLLAGKINTKYPATLLNLHSDVTLICTEDCIEND